MDDNGTPTRGKYTSSLAVERAADILLLLGSQPDASLGYIASAIGASGGATHRICHALMFKGLISQDPASDRYALAWNSLTLARARGGTKDIRRVSLPIMSKLRDDTNGTVTLNVRREDQLVCIEQVDSRAELRWVGEVGRVEVLYAGAAGKMLLTQLSDAELDAYFQRTELAVLTSETITDAAQLRQQIIEARRQGFTVGRGERAEGIVGLAAPIFDATNTMVAVVSVGAPAFSMGPERIDACRQALVAAADAISVELGHCPSR